LKPKRTAGAAVWLGIGLLAAGSASGETWKGRNLRFTIARAALRMGPLRIQPVLYLTDAGYDSNIYGQIERPVKDYWLQAGPGINVYAQVRKKVVFSVSESPRYVYFFETRRERAWNNYLQGEISLLFNRIFISGGGLLNNYKFRYPFEIDIWPRLNEKGVFGSFLYQAGRRTSFSIGARRTDYAFENLENEFANLKARMNRTESYLTATGYFQATPRVMFSLGVEYGLIEFDDTEASYGDSESRAAFVGIDFSPTGRVRGSVKIGYKELSPRVAGKAGFEGLVGDSSVSLRVSRALTVRGQYGRDVFFSVWYDNAFFVNNRYGAGASLYVIRRKIRLDYDYSIHRDSYGSGRRLDRTTQTVGFFFRLGEKTGIGLRGGTYDWKYNYYPRDSRRTFVGLNLTYDY
jgi:hypothetical protein